MAGVYHSISVQCKKATQALLQHSMIARGQIAAANAARKEHIADKNHLFGGIMEANATIAMARRIQ